MRDESPCAIIGVRRLGFAPLGCVSGRLRTWLGEVDLRIPGDFFGAEFCAYVGALGLGVTHDVVDVFSKPPFTLEGLVSVCNVVL